MIPDESTRRQELEAGSIDGYDLPSPTDWAGLEEEGNSVEIRDPFNIFYFGLNPTTNPALKKDEVREALQYAIDREQLVQTQLPEGAEVATQFMPSTVSGYNSDLQATEYDPEKAKQLLAEAGRGEPHPDLRLPDRRQPALHAGPAAALRSHPRTNLEEVGITVKVETASWNGGYLDNVTAGKYDAYLLGWTGDYDAAFNFIGTFFGNLKENDFGTSEYPWGKQLAQDLADADAIVDEGERAAAFEEVNAQIMEEYMPGVPISHSPPALVVGPDVEGVIPSPLTAEEFDTVSVGGE